MLYTGSLNSGDMLTRESALYIIYGFRQQYHICERGETGLQTVHAKGEGNF